MIEFPPIGFVNLYSTTVRDYIRDLQATSAEAEEEAYSPGGSGLSYLDPSMSLGLAFQTLPEFLPRELLKPVTVYIVTCGLEGFCFPQS